VNALFDWLDALLTPCPLHLREMAYKKELFGIRRRWRQWGQAWRPHCENTCRVLLSATKRCPRRRNAIVFGSGFLHDVPLGELCAAFERVILVDLIHPFSTRRKAKRLGAALLTADVSETAEGVWLAVEKPGTPLPQSRPRLFLGDDDVDFVASVNLLSQLPVMPENYLRRWQTHPAEQIDAYCRNVIEAHLSYLRALPGVVALIADVEARTVGQAGHEVARSSTLYGAAMPFSGEQWLWPLVPHGVRPPYHSEQLVVVGVEDVKQ
jgi:hypothetical protein